LESPAPRDPISAVLFKKYLFGARREAAPQSAQFEKLGQALLDAQL